jgi:hypothetical protein
MLMLCLAAFAAGWLAGMEFVGNQDALLHLVPLILVAVPIVLGRYFGEDFMVSALTRARKPRRPLRAAVRYAKRSLRPHPRGGRLLAHWLAGRAPPLAEQSQA